MAVLVVLLVSWLIFRGLGALSVPIFLTWHDALPYALAIMFLFTATAHFNSIKHDLARMIPPLFPNPPLIVAITGVLEIAGAFGLMIPRVRSVAADCLIALLIGMFIANVHAARNRVTLRGKPVTPLWLRIPMQLLFLGLLWWSARP